MANIKLFVHSKFRTVTHKLLKYCLEVCGEDKKRREKVRRFCLYHLLNSISVETGAEPTVNSLPKAHSSSYIYP
jgi:hypothetical protein